MQRSPRKKLAKLTVSVHQRHPAKVSKRRLGSLARKVWQNESTSRGRVEIILVAEDFIQDLNRSFLNENRPTDVIAFPIEPADGGDFEGEIYVSLDQVTENAKKYAIAFAEELDRMVVHAMLHFVGYDDHTHAGKRKMTARENFYLERSK
jgi:rRNA maturation RNase YbeY